MCFPPYFLSARSSLVRSADKALRVAVILHERAMRGTHVGAAAALHAHLRPSPLSSTLQSAPPSSSTSSAACIGGRDSGSSGQFSTQRPQWMQGAGLQGCGILAVLQDDDSVRGLEDGLLQRVRGLGPSSGPPYRTLPGSSWRPPAVLDKIAYAAYRRGRRRFFGSLTAEPSHGDAAVDQRHAGLHVIRPFFASVVTFMMM